MINVSLYADIKNIKLTKPVAEMKKDLAKADLELVEATQRVFQLKWL